MPEARSAAARAGGGAANPRTALADPVAVLGSRRYLALLVAAAVLGVPIAAAAFWFLKLLTLVQDWVYTDLPEEIGFVAAPIWWPVVPLVVAGAVVGLTVRYLPGRGGESPVEGFKPGARPEPRALPGIAIAAAA